VLGAEDATSVRSRIGFLPEERGLYKRMTPIDAIAFFAGLKGVPEAEGRRRAKEMLEAQGLGYAMKRPIKDLSKGMAQKVQLISALAHEPELVVLDEPFSGLDPVNQQALEGDDPRDRRARSDGAVLDPRDAARRAPVRQGRVDGARPEGVRRRCVHGPLRRAARSGAGRRPLAKARSRPCPAWAR
jgi:ABC-type transport system involved in cytochrome c biogenesis ATPase subunit